MPEDKLSVERLEQGAILRLGLGGSKGNVLDAALVAALDTALADAEREPGLKAILVEGQGRHFSFGASVQEHLPESCAAMLTAFHGLFRTMLDASVVTL
ncbi:MAG TPA: cyclohexa-1,5-dienecarbonyl-CoA hydratase, partial [Vicinamibacteria bacterium]|nr:cyclohexa-1,5-dienecarbonyl-CoA hydratase [Vicinamibacteria bacterium]